MPQILATAHEAAIERLAIAQVYPNPSQPRKVFDAGALQELAESIQKSGLMSPIVVAPRPSEFGDYLIVAGERRWRASKLAGLELIPAIVRHDLTDQGVAELALIENLLRRDLDAVEEARAYQSMLENQGHTLETLAKLLGHRDTRKVTERLSLLNLDNAFQTAVQKAALSPSSALEMSRLSVEGQYKLWRAIQDGKADTMPKLRRLAAAIFDLENQVELFAFEAQTPAQRAAADKVDRFVAEAGRLLSLITEDDLTVIEAVQKADAHVCLDRLKLLTQVIYKVSNALAANVAKQQALSA